MTVSVAAMKVDSSAFYFPLASAFLAITGSLVMTASAPAALAPRTPAASSTVHGTTFRPSVCAAPISSAVVGQLGDHQSYPRDAAKTAHGPFPVRLRNEVWTPGMSCAATSRFGGQK